MAGTRRQRTNVRQSDPDQLVVVQAIHSVIAVQGPEADSRQSVRR